ncbi:MAG TPA: thiolase family protein [Pirellulaceae bacterium]|nr:thiolase family protein [Pirellulaceae bacterium]
MSHHMPVLVAGLRTPFGRAGKGAYQDFRPDDLLIELIAGHRQRFSELWQYSSAEDLIVGCAYPEGEQGYNVARMVAVGSGLDTPGVTVNRLCASSLEAVAMAAARIRAGFGRQYLVGGVESMSRIPRRGANFSESARVKQSNSLAYTPNGDTAERVARKFPQLSRAVQEDFAARSHELADAAYQRGDYARQLYPLRIERDEFVRVPVDRAKMASLSPAFAPDGVVTAATSSPLTDGAAIAWVVTPDTAQTAGFVAGLEIVDVTVAQVRPEIMGMGPVPATRLLLERNKLSPADIVAWEINEAFAIQVLASLVELDVSWDNVNDWGGAIAVGHPLGASGLRLVMTLHDRLAQRNEAGAWGVATLCVGGGQGMSLLGRWRHFT